MESKTRKMEGVLRISLVPWNPTPQPELGPPLYTMYTVLVSGIYCKYLLGSSMESNIKQVHNPFLQSTN